MEFYYVTVRESKKTPLAAACFYGNDDVVRQADENGKTPLYNACRNNWSGIVRLLLARYQH
jgi:hypothetical protein